LFTNQSSYMNVLNRTMSVLNHLGFQDPLDYTLHIPMMFNKKIYEIEYMSAAEKNKILYLIFGSIYHRNKIFFLITGLILLQN
jgi:hypothetical protein